MVYVECVFCGCWFMVAFFLKAGLELFFKTVGVFQWSALGRQGFAFILFRFRHRCLLLPLGQTGFRFDRKRTLNDVLDSWRLS